MAKNKYYLSNVVIPLIQQKTALLYAYKDANCIIKNNQLFWRGKIKPTPLSKEYDTLIIYKLLNPPQVWIFGDELENLEDITFPHKYRIDIDKKMVNICLYKNIEFNSKKILADTIVPWTIEWLYFYEIWLATGEWYGGGEHPIQEKSQKQ